MVFNESHHISWIMTITKWTFVTIYHKPFNVQQNTFQNCARSKYETFNSIYDIYLRVTVTVIFEWKLRIGWPCNLGYSYSEGYHYHKKGFIIGIFKIFIPNSNLWSRFYYFKIWRRVWMKTSILVVNYVGGGRNITLTRWKDFLILVRQIFQTTYDI